MPRGRKRCQGCSEEVAAANKQCPNCGLALQKGLEDSQGSAYGSPVQMKRMGLRTAILIRTPDARVQREPSRRATGQGNRSTASGDHSPVTEDRSSGSSIPEGYQLSPDYADQMEHDSQQKAAVSPVSRVPLRWHSNNPVEQYVRGLQMSQHRCVLVGDNIRGAYLYAVAGYDCTNTGNICIVVRSKSLISCLPSCRRPLPCGCDCKGTCSSCRSARACMSWSFLCCIPAASGITFIFAAVWTLACTF